MDLSQALILLYESLYQQLSLKSHFKFFLTVSDEILIEKFISWVNVSKQSRANPDFLIAFFEFQFSHYSGVQTKYGKNQIMFNWVIGPKAIERFEKRTISKRWLVRLKNKEIGLSLKEALKPVKIIKSYENKIYDFEEKEKQRFYNTPKGLLYCLTTTTLYNPMSKLCNECNNKEDCLKVLENEYPKLYNKRT